MSNTRAPNDMFYTVDSANASTTDIIVESREEVRHRDGPYAHRHHVQSHSEDVDIAQAAYNQSRSSRDDPFSTPIGTPVAESVISFPSHSQYQTQSNLPSEPSSSRDSPMGSSTNLPANFTSLVGGTTSRLSMMSAGYNFGSLANGNGPLPNPSLSRVSTSASLVGMVSGAEIPAVPRRPESVMSNRHSSGIRESFASPPMMATRPLSSAVPRSRRASLLGGGNGKDTFTTATLATKLAAVPDAPEKGEKEQIRPSTALPENYVLDKPWLKLKNTRGTISTLLTYTFMFVGIAASAVRCFFGFHDVRLITQNLCLVLEDDFNSASGQGINTNVWAWEVQLDGYG